MVFLFSSFGLLAYTVNFSVYAFGNTLVAIVGKRGALEHG